MRTRGLLAHWKQRVWLILTLREIKLSFWRIAARGDGRGDRYRNNCALEKLRSWRIGRVAKCDASVRDSTLFESFSERLIAINAVVSIIDSTRINNYNSKERKEGSVHITKANRLSVEDKHWIFTCRVFPEKLIDKWKSPTPNLQLEWLQTCVTFL